ncbi:MAG: 4Fe-4S dicluster domain-containing protein [Desulfobacterales bacterium]|jgi:Na+-transporting NADH:ubiquinone oxidoreductase subunit A
MENVRIRKGYNLKVAGSPAATAQKTEQPTHLALLPEHIPFVKPRLKIAKGDRVALGSPLIEDKRNPQIKFLSPGGGCISDIRYGARRVIQEIIITLDKTEKAVEFERYSREEIDKMSREQVVQALIAGGLWPLIKELPFRDHARPDVVPPAMFVCLDSLEPFHPLPQVYLNDNEALFRFGLNVLNKLAAAPVYVCRHAQSTDLASTFKDIINLTYTGNYPAHDPGVLLYRIKSSPKENRAWFIDGQDVVSIARLLRNGVYPTERVVSLGGSASSQPSHAMTRMGAPLSVIAAGQNGSSRYIQGGILTGYKTAPQSYLGYSETALNLLPEGDHKGELLGLFSPGYRKPTFSRAFLSAVNRDNLEINCNMHGGERACIACGYCTLVCPVDILPQFTYKAILAGEVEESLEHGLLDCAECALCSYVCPSKIELFETLKKAKAEFYKEQVSR